MTLTMFRLFTHHTEPFTASVLQWRLLLALVRARIRITL